MPHMRTAVISRRFAIGVYPITVSEFGYFCEDTGYKKSRRDDVRHRFPIVNVTWHDAQAYLNWLSRKTQQEYRLPTEVEWDYAGSCGAETVRVRNTESRGNIRAQDMQLQYKSAVDQMQRNEWGLYGMLEDFYEWCEDRAAENPARNRVARGRGRYETYPTICSAFRAAFAPNSQFGDLGFRCVRYVD
jgi:formylglycine-generating enzyme required for sulfatase activity